MKTIYLIPVIASLVATSSWAEERIYKCDNNVYTNTLQDPRAQGCKPISGGNVTVVQSQRPNPATAARAPAASQPGQRIDSGDQRAKDSDARMILDSELKKAEARQAELLKEYNNGEPEKLGPEHRNNQKYVDRIAELKANISRNESDIAGIRRELGRVTTGSGASAAK